MARRCVHSLILSNKRLESRTHYLQISKYFKLCGYFRSDRCLLDGLLRLILVLVYGTPSSRNLSNMLAILSLVLHNRYDVMLDLSEADQTLHIFTNENMNNFS